VDWSLKLQTNGDKKITARGSLPIAYGPLRYYRFMRWLQQQPSFPYRAVEANKSPNAPDTQPQVNRPY
jgi:hypothetical protein